MSRLEEIKEVFDIQKMQTFSDRKTVPFNLKDIEWLIKQAERVQELEELEEDYKTVNRELHQRGKKVRKQNKRYREALVKLRNDIGKIKTGYEKNVFVIKTVDDALIDWEVLE